VDAWAPPFPGLIHHGVLRVPASAQFPVVRLSAVRLSGTVAEFEEVASGQLVRRMAVRVRALLALDHGEVCLPL